MELFKRPQHKEVLASNLNWQVLDPFAEKAFGHDQITQLITEGNRLAARYKNGADVNIGVTTISELEEHAKNKIFSIAAMAATTKRFQKTTSLILVKNTESEETLIYAIGIVSGNVVVDALITLDQIYSTHQQYAALCENTGRIYYIHGDIVPHGVTLNHAYSLNELLQEKSGKKILIEPLRDEKKILYVIYAVVFVIIWLAAWKTWDWYSAGVQRELQFKNDQRNSPEVIYNQSVMQLMFKGHLTMPASALQMIEMVEKFPVRSGGWLLTHLKCDEENCQTHWSSEGGTYASFKASAPAHWNAPQYSSNDKDALGDLKSIQLSFPHKLPKTKLPDHSTWPRANEFAFNTGVSWQRFQQDRDWNATLQTPEIQAIPPGLTKAQVTNHPMATHAMKWETKNQRWETVKATLPTFPPHVVLNQFEIQINKISNTISFSGSGLAYVNK